MFGVDDTIVALGTSSGSASRGVLRLSGTQALEVVGRLFRGQLKREYATRTSGRLACGQDASDCEVPCSLSVWPTSRSYTGQPTVEVHIPGSPALAEMVLDALYRQGARPARRGEFTLRAFLAGHMDLVQAEAVLGTIDAFDHVELSQALRQLAGGLSGQLAALRAELLDLLADLEAGLDFVDEDIEFVGRDELHQRLMTAQGKVERLREQAVGRMHSSECSRVVLIGPPNAGKSSLFNRLVGHDAALVSSVAGTTRDYLTGSVAWRGQQFVCVDTAGCEEARSGIEEVAQELRTERVDSAELLIRCCPADEMSGEDFEDAVLGSEPHCIDVITKSDLLGSRQGEVNPRCDAPISVVDQNESERSDRGAISDCHSVAASEPIRVSAQTGEGIDRLLDRIVRELGELNRHGGELIGSTAARASESLRRASESLRRALAAAESRTLGDECLAAEIREVLDALGEIVGAVYTDDVLDRLFSRFCIGK